MLAWLFGGGCPACDQTVVGPLGAPVRPPPARLVASEDGEGLVCTRCDVVIEPRRGRWRYAHGEFRRLPGLLGLLCWRERAA
jgi:hypothetical protein